MTNICTSRKDYTHLGRSALALSNNRTLTDRGLSYWFQSKLTLAIKSSSSLQMSHITGSLDTPNEIQVRLEARGRRTIVLDSWKFNRREDRSATR